MRNRMSGLRAYAAHCKPAIEVARNQGQCGCVPVGRSAPKDQGQSLSISSRKIFTTWSAIAGVSSMS